MTLNAIAELLVVEVHGMVLKNRRLSYPCCIVEFAQPGSKSKNTVLSSAGVNCHSRVCLQRHRLLSNYIRRCRALECFIDELARCHMLRLHSCTQNGVQFNQYRWRICSLFIVFGPTNLTPYITIIKPSSVMLKWQNIVLISLGVHHCSIICRISPASGDLMP